jgi:hypothetical protein
VEQAGKPANVGFARQHLLPCGVREHDSAVLVHDDQSVGVQVRRRLRPPRRHFDVLSPHGQLGRAAKMRQHGLVETLLLRLELGARAPENAAGDAEVSERAPCRRLPRESGAAVEKRR